MLSFLSGSSPTTPRPEGAGAVVQDNGGMVTGQATKDFRDVLADLPPHRDLGRVLSKATPDQEVMPEPESEVTADELEAFEGQGSDELVDATAMQGGLLDLEEEAAVEERGAGAWAFSQGRPDRLPAGFAGWVPSVPTDIENAPRDVALPERPVPAADADTPWNMNPEDRLPDPMTTAQPDEMNAPVGVVLDDLVRAKLSAEAAEGDSDQRTRDAEKLTADDVFPHQGISIPPSMALRQDGGAVTTRVHSGLLAPKPERALAASYRSDASPFPGMIEGEPAEILRTDRALGSIPARSREIGLEHRFEGSPRLSVRESPAAGPPPDAGPGLARTSMAVSDVTAMTAASKQPGMPALVAAQTDPGVGRSATPKGTDGLRQAIKAGDLDGQGARQTAVLYTDAEPSAPRDSERAIRTSVPTAGSAHGVGKELASFGTAAAFPVCEAVASPGTGQINSDREITEARPRPDQPASRLAPAPDQLARIPVTRQQSSARTTVPGVLQTEWSDGLTRTSRESVAAGSAEKNWFAAPKSDVTAASISVPQTARSESSASSSLIPAVAPGHDGPMTREAQGTVTPTPLGKIEPGLPSQARKAREVAALVGTAERLVFAKPSADVPIGPGDAMPSPDERRQPMRPDAEVRRRLPDRVEAQTSLPGRVGPALQASVPMPAGGGMVVTPAAADSRIAELTADSVPPAHVEAAAQVRSGPVTPMQAATPLGQSTPPQVLQVSAAIQASTERSFDIHLSPVELGKVRITLSPSDSGITVSILADRPETLDLLRRHSDLLAQDFRDLGYDSAAFSFGGDPEGERGGDRDRMTPDRSAHADEIDLVQEQEQSPGPTKPMIGAGRMDLRI
ncbi:Flagellar hook-length control protein FliK [Roseovarius indicus]|uniref:Flagellar hook-length control protein FliK n=3 Tax=Roseovarius indicus TaxID=540747 RepID=A0A5P3AL17_9RHOB|nr:Flagellar hook-length control protein FliK [Roseovarius indicus]SFD74387.1 hook-length control protein FliK [Roseovarius indicus]